MAKFGGVLAVLAALSAWSGEVGQQSSAAIEQIYTLPFFGNYTIACGFGCYTGHEGTDYTIGASSAGDGAVAALGGNAYWFTDTAVPGAGKHLSIYHGNGHRTRYLHLQDWTIATRGQVVCRGCLIGHEGSSGTSDGFVHLHFETRTDAPSGDSDKSGTAVDPYASSTYMWRSNPPRYAHGKADRVVWRPSNGNWYILYTGGGSSTQAWGDPGDVAVPADYNGDGKADIAVWRPSNGTWYILGGGTQAWGNVGDIAVPADYNGDGSADIAVWRPANHNWYILGGSTQAWGDLGDIAVPADYNGDGKADIAVWRPSNGTWYILGGGTQAWGNVGDIAVPADYNGDGKADIAVWRPPNHTWYILYTGGGSSTALWGDLGDIAVPADYNGDGKADIAVWRPSNGTWYILYTGGGSSTQAWGASGDKPLAADMDGQ